jgi:hypothetical protein
VLAPLVETRVAWTDRRLKAAWIVIAATAVVAGIFLPRSFTNNDEFYYSGQAHVLSKGRLTPQPGDPLLVPYEIPAQAFRYPVAWPAVLVPARLFGIRPLYVTALAIHLLGGLAVARMLVRRGASSGLAAFYVFHPVFWLYSRTLLSDLPATAALLVAMDAWENRDRKTASGALGFAGAARIANVAVLFGFGLAVLSSAKRRLHDVLALVLVAAAFWVIQILVNHALGGYWLVSPYIAQNALLVTGRMTAENGALYLAGLALLPPFPLLFAIARPRHMDRWALVALVVVLAYLPMSWHNASTNILETLVGGQRYVMPAHAALMIATARTWSAAPLLRSRWLALVGGLAVAVGACLSIARIEKRHRAAADAVASCHPNRLAFNRFANKVAGSVVATTYAVAEDTPLEHGDWDVLVIAPGVQSNQPGNNVSWTSKPPRIVGGVCRQVGDYAIYDFSGRCPAFGQACTLE